jgi:hypothetical protein
MYQGKAGRLNPPDPRRGHLAGRGVGLSRGVCRAISNASQFVAFLAGWE